MSGGITKAELKERADAKIKELQEHLSAMVSIFEAKLILCEQVITEKNKKIVKLEKLVGLKGESMSETEQAKKPEKTLQECINELSQSNQGHVPYVNSPCPSCGHCPTCGRRNASPYRPWYGDYPMYQPRTF